MTQEEYDFKRRNTQPPKFRMGDEVEAILPRKAYARGCIVFISISTNDFTWKYRLEGLGEHFEEDVLQMVQKC
jgi:hypothetical protein